ncbi:hypothetical protein BGX38DRAFT_1139058 [Terfezia claveryi]|nr:hypothetical protein BGX38DRAFT_1139058 [Terfezia claveryi]
MHPKRRGPTSQNIAKLLRAQGPIQHKHQHLQAIDAPNQATSSSQLTEVPSGNTSTTLEHNDQDLALSAITELREEGHASAVGSGQHRKQYTKEFKLAALTYWREQSEPAPGPRLSKYMIAKNLQIIEKMLKDWISKEDTIVAMHSKQKRATKGRKPQLPDMEDHLHTKFLTIRATGVKVGRSWFMAEAKLWYEAKYLEKVLTDMLGRKSYIGFNFSQP